MRYSDSEMRWRSKADQGENQRDSEMLLSPSVLVQSLGKMTCSPRSLLFNPLGQAQIVEFM